MPTRTIRQITISQVATLALLAVMGGMAMIATRRLVRDAAIIGRTYAVRGTLRALSASLEAAKADTRGYLLTGDSDYAHRAAAALDSASGTARRLASLVADNADQAARVRLLPSLIAIRRAKIMETLALPALSVGARDQYAARLREGEAIAASIAGAIEQMDQAEVLLLSSRVQAEHRSQASLLIILAALFGVAIAITWLFRRALVRDVRHRAQIEAQLRTSEARYAGILSIAADAIVSIDDSHRIVHFNRSAVTMFGYTEREATGQPLDILLPSSRTTVHPQHIAAFAASTDTARRMGDRREVAGRRRDGTEFPAEVSISKLNTPTGRLFTAVIRDVTRQRRMEHYEHTLAVAGARLGGTLDYEDMLAVVVALPIHAMGDWCFLDIVERADDDVAVLRRIVSEHVDRVRHVALRDIAAAGIDWDSPSVAIDVIRTGNAVLESTVSADWLEAHTASDAASEPFLRLGVGSLLCVPLSVRDLTIGALTIGRHDPSLTPDDLPLAQAFASQAARAIDNTLLYQRAQRARAVRDEVLAIVSHDLRTPASAVTMCARTLLEHPPENEADRRDLYATILESAHWMYRLIQDLLDAASIDAGRLAVDIEAVHVDSLLAAAIDPFTTRARDASVAVVVDADDQLPPVLADPGRIVQVLGNLITNALRFTSGGGTITIAAARHPEGLVISVQDTGTGIAPDHLPHVFDRFWHVGGVGRGSGLGLAIAAGIVQAHGGRIWVDSALGTGSTFSFLLPTA